MSGRSWSSKSRGRGTKHSDDRVSSTVAHNQKGSEMKAGFAIPAVLAMALVWAPGSAFAQSEKLIGNISAVDASAGTFSVAESHGAREMDFQVDRSSRLVLRGTRNSVKLDDLPVGSAVSVVFVPGAEGEAAVVRNMQVTPADPGARD